MRTILSLAEKGKAGYFEIWKKKDEYILYLCLSHTGQVMPICKSKKNLHSRTLFNTKMDWYDNNLIEYFNNQEVKQYYCRTLKDKTHWKKIQKTLRKKYEN